jgi:hypothetical protein
MEARNGPGYLLRPVPYLWYIAVKTRGMARKYQCARHKDAICESILKLDGEETM